MQWPKERCFSRRQGTQRTLVGRFLSANGLKNNYGIHSKFTNVGMSELTMATRAPANKDE